MNKQRKVLITTTYNEMGIIIDTKAEEVEIEDKEEISFRQWLFDNLGMTEDEFDSSTTAYGKKFFHDQYFQYLSERNAITTGKATGVAE